LTYSDFKKNAQQFHNVGFYCGWILIQ